MANPLRTTPKRALGPVEQLLAHGRAIPLSAPKVRNPEELAIGAKQIASFGVHIYVTDTEIDA